MIGTSSSVTRVDCLSKRMMSCPRRPTLCTLQLVVVVIIAAISTTSKLQFVAAFQGGVGGGTNTAGHYGVAQIVLPPLLPSSPIRQQHAFPLLKDEIRRRIGSPNSYALENEHVVVMVNNSSPMGVLCESRPPLREWEKEAGWTRLANDIHLVMQAIHAGSLSVSLNNDDCRQQQRQQRKQRRHHQGAYYIPSSITLVKVDMTTIPTSINDIIMHMCRDDTCAVDVNDYLFNSEGVETNEILFDPSGGSNCLEVSGGESRRMNSSNRTARIFACRGGDGGGDLTTMAKATSDVYILLPTARTVNDDFHDQVVVWKFGIEYNIATINIGSIPTLGSSSSSSSSKVYIPTIQRTDR